MPKEILEKVFIPVIAMVLCRVTSTPWYDPCEKCYYNTLTLNAMPSGPLAEHVERKNRPKLSPFESFQGPCCEEEQCPFVIYKSHRDIRPICENDYDWLLGFLVDNGYKVDYNMTKMINNGEYRNSRNRLLCFFTYPQEN
jgi:hypothetical protein